jgi:hypothetical protein
VFFVYKTDWLVCKERKRWPGAFGRRRGFGQRPDRDC